VTKHTQNNKNTLSNTHML